MSIDLYTKTILTIIALLLAIVALKPLVQPTPAMAQRSFKETQFSGSDGWFYLFDGTSGDAWVYDGRGRVRSHLKFTQLGQPASNK
jgi:hypothetical protein